MAEVCNPMKDLLSGENTIELGAVVSEDASYLCDASNLPLVASHWRIIPSNPPVATSSFPSGDSVDVGGVVIAIDTS